MKTLTPDTENVEASPRRSRAVVAGAIAILVSAVVGAAIAIWAADSGDGPVAADNARIELTFTGEDASYVGDREIIEGPAEVVFINDSTVPVWFVVQYVEPESAILQTELSRGSDFVTNLMPPGETPVFEQCIAGRMARSIVLEPGTYLIQVAEPGEDSTHVWQPGVIEVVPDASSAGDSVPADVEDLDTPTDPITFGDMTIDTYNSTPVLNDAVEWGLQRFAVAGLDVPPIASATFTVQSEDCDDIHGRCIRTEEGFELTFCVDEEAACGQPECNEIVPGWKAVVLHEIAHVWLDTHPDLVDIEGFLVHVGLDTWRDRRLPWDQNGVEHAADTIAWGLMDRDIEMLRIHQPTPDELTEGFSILTGIDPLPKNE